MELYLKISDFNRVVELNPKHGAALLLRGISYAELDDVEKAIKDFEVGLMYSEAEAQKFVNDYGMWRTKFDLANATLEGERGPLTKLLTEEKIKKIMKWIEV